MNKNLIVEIFVPEKGGGGKRGNIATGYPVAKDLILTARHPHYPKAGRDRPHNIEVRWRHPEVAALDRQAVEKVVWESERWDLALLRWPLPEAIATWGCLSDRRPADDTTWVSSGFPCAGGRKDGQRESFEMQGPVYSTGDDKDRFPIAEVAGPSDQDAWKGASGSPVFVECRILGVIVSVPLKLKARRLSAVPIWRVLREEPRFRNTIGFDEREARHAAVLKRLVAVLEPAPVAISALADQVPGGAGELIGAGSSKKAELIAGRLLDLDIEGAIDACSKAYVEVQDREMEAAALTEAVQIILPAIYDHGVVEVLATMHTYTKVASLNLYTGERRMGTVSAPLRDRVSGPIGARTAHHHACFQRQ